MSRYRRAGIYAKVIKLETDNQYAKVGINDVALDGSYTVEQLRRVANLLEQHLSEEEFLKDTEEN